MLLRAGMSWDEEDDSKESSQSQAASPLFSFALQMLLCVLGGSALCIVMVETDSPLLPDANDRAEAQTAD